MFFRYPGKLGKKPENRGIFWVTRPGQSYLDPPIPVC